MKKLLFAMFAILMAVACTNVDEPIGKNGNVLQEKEVNANIRTPEEVAECVQNLVDAIDRKNPSRAGNRRVVSEVVPVKNSHIASRSIGPNHKFTHEYDTVKFYFVNFADSAGFAVAGAELDSEPVYAIIDHGNAKWDGFTTYEHFHLANFMDMSIVGYYNGGQTEKRDSVIKKINEWDITEMKAPILETNWSQIDPYNRYCPLDGDKRCPTGCVPTALAQILSHFQTIDSVPYQDGRKGHIKMMWSRILSQCRGNNGRVKPSDTPLSERVSHLMRYIGRGIGAKYSQKSTSADPEDGLRWLRDHANLDISKLKDYDISEIIGSIKDGNPVYGRGSSGKKQLLGLITTGYKHNHSWVYDGYLKAEDTSVWPFKKRDFVHCNWGWNGADNGYYLSKVFETANGPEITDNEAFEDLPDPSVDSNSEGGDIKYGNKLKYCKIWKKQ
ncbi:MAG: hypothetical protein HFJ91_02440 [Muribaculaceae bacterium]|nr:hypothetical protein [Muribaculaceae bacterium]